MPGQGARCVKEVSVSTVEERLASPSSRVLRETTCLLFSHHYRRQALMAALNHPQSISYSDSFCCVYFWNCPWCEAGMISCFNCCINEQEMCFLSDKNNLWQIACTITFFLNNYKVNIQLLKGRYVFLNHIIVVYLCILNLVACSYCYLHNYFPYWKEQQCKIEKIR